MPRGFLLVLLAVAVVAVVAACEDDDGIVDPPEGEYTFIYVASGGTPAITSVDVRGSFNGWGSDPSPLAMTQQSDGSWRVTRVFEPGTYQYKYVFNGDQWPSSMCNDATWGNPANGGKVDPNVTNCVADGFGGQNGQLVID